MLRKTEEKEYIIEKKDKYNCDDFKKIIMHFNKKLVEFLEELLKICKENKWKPEADDIVSGIEFILLSTKINKSVAISHFAIKVYPYYNFIKNRDERNLINQDYSGAVKKMDCDGISKIMKTKKLWLESGTQNKEYIFAALEYLCYCIVHYEEVGLTTGYVKKHFNVISA